MVINSAERIGQVQEYYFSRKLAEIAQINSSGERPVINLGIGSPDMAPHPDVVEALISSARRPDTHGYQSYKGLPGLRAAFSHWLSAHFQVDTDPETEILPLLGSKEGIMHISMAFLQEGDEVLIPDPGYPSYASASTLAGATVRTYSLTEEDGWLPDFDALDKSDLSRVKIMWLNYPHMPTGRSASLSIFERAVSFARRHDILLCHDNPYCFILNPESPLSIFSIPGSKDLALELHSLSKAHNMAGWRVGAIVGQSDYLTEILKFKSNMDSGSFRPIQEAAIAALQLDAAWYRTQNEAYRKRKVLVEQIFDTIGCTYSSDQQGLFVWAKIPTPLYKSGYELSDEILYGSGVFITPGGIFGSQGDSYVRISLCSTTQRLTQALQRIKAHQESTNPTQI